MMYVIVGSLLLIILYVYVSRKRTLESYYRTLNMDGGESHWKCGSCTQYGSNFDYKRQNKERLYGVPLGCQKIF